MKFAFPVKTIELIGKVSVAVLVLLKTHPVKDIELQSRRNNLQEDYTRTATNIEKSIWRIVYWFQYARLHDKWLVLPVNRKVRFRCIQKFGSCSIYYYSTWSQYVSRQWLIDFQYNDATCRPVKFIRRLALQFRLHLDEFVFNGFLFFWHSISRFFL